MIYFLFGPRKDQTVLKYWGEKNLFLPQILAAFRLKNHRTMGFSRFAPPSSNFLIFKKESSSSKLSRWEEFGSWRLRSYAPASQAPQGPQAHFRIFPGAPAGRRPRPLMNSETAFSRSALPLMNILEPFQEPPCKGDPAPSWIVKYEPPP